MPATVSKRSTPVHDRDPNWYEVLQVIPNYWLAGFAKNLERFRGGRPRADPVLERRGGHVDAAE